MELSEFIQTVKSTGIAKSNRYLVNFNKPKSVYMANEGDLRNYVLFCDQVELPGLSYATSPIRTFGEVKETPYDKNSESITLAFYVDANLNIKQFFDRWMNSIMNANRTWSYYDDYITPIMSITVLDNGQNSVYAVNLYECYPKAISPISVSYANNEIMKMSVTMQYKYWTSEQLIGGKGNNATNQISPIENLIKAKLILNGELPPFLEPTSQVTPIQDLQNRGLIT